MLLWLLLSLWQIGAFPLAESSDEAANVLLGFRLAWFVDDPVAIASPFTQGGPLFSYLPSVFGAHLLPVSEFTMRLPYALVGAAQMPLLLALTSMVFGRKAAAIAGLMLLGSGLFAINRLTLGTSVFIVFELAGALMLVRYLESGQRRWLVLASVALAAATLTFVGGVLLLIAALAFAWRKKKDRRDLEMAVLAGPVVLFGLVLVSSIVGLTFSNWQGAPAEFTGANVFARLFSSARTFEFSVSDYAGIWTVYVGVPVVTLVLIGLVEAAIHNRASRLPILVLMGLAAAHTLPWLFLDPRMENPVLVAPLVMAVAAFGWVQLIRQLSSVVAQAAVAMAVASVALAGVAWNQAVFNPESEFSEDLQSLRRYALSLEHGHGLFEDDARGIKAIAEVIRLETDPDARIFVGEGVPASALSLYSARSAEPINLDLFAAGAEGIEGAYLVIKGEEESYNAGLSGATNVIANHRVFADGESLYQLVQFSKSGESFETPIWWRADIAAARLFRDYDHYSDFLTPLTRNTAGE